VTKAVDPDVAVALAQQAGTRLQDGLYSLLVGKSEKL